MVQGRGSRGYRRSLECCNRGGIVSSPLQPHEFKHRLSVGRKQ